jgi:hypothetical protein
MSNFRLRLRANWNTGMLEQWNNGPWENGILALGYWVNGKSHFDHIIKSG